MRRVEEGIQRAVADYLDLCLPDHAVWFHCPNQRGGRSKVENVILKRMGVKPGVPDVIIISSSDRLTKHFHYHRVPMVICIELKAPRKYLSTSQKKMKRRLEDNGVLYGPVCRSVEDVSDFLNPLLPMKGRSGGAPRRHTRS